MRRTASYFTALAYIAWSPVPFTETFATIDGPAEEIARQLERFMRSFDPAEAPALFTAATELPEDAKVLAELLRFSKGNAARIGECLATFTR